MISKRPPPTGPHQDGLHHTLALDAFGQLVERTFVHARARLVLAGLQELKLQRARCITVGRRCSDLGPSRASQAQAQAFGFFGNHGNDGWPHRKRGRWQG